MGVRCVVSVSRLLCLFFLAHKLQLVSSIQAIQALAPEVYSRLLKIMVFWTNFWIFSLQMSPESVGERVVHSTRLLLILPCVYFTAQVSFLKFRVSEQYGVRAGAKRIGLKQGVEYKERWVKAKC